MLVIYFLNYLKENYFLLVLKDYKICFLTQISIERRIYINLSSRYKIEKKVSV